VFVTDPGGRPWEGVRVSAVGAVTREATSDRDGVARLNALRAGTYRVRFESPEVVTFEREIAIKAGPTAEFEVTLNAAPQGTTPAASGAPTPPVQLVQAPGPQAPVAWFAPMAASLPDWIERHYIGRLEPSAEGLVGEAAGATASVLQVRDPLPARARSDADQFFYVIAGDGTARVGDRQETITAGWLVVVPRGTSVSFERRGRNPLILLAVVAPRS
jgi:mannose-6-phosphate isomerase-like protein (cupin superfamily)